MKRELTDKFIERIKNSNKHKKLIKHPWGLYKFNWEIIKKEGFCLLKVSLQIHRFGK